MSPKEKYLKTATVFATMLVVIGHSLPARFDYNPDPIHLESIINTIYLFHMPIFFLISGFHFLRSFECDNFYDIFKNRFKRIIAPYLIFSFIALPLKFLLNDHAIRPMPSLMEGAFDIILYPWANPIIFYWFMPTLFLISMIFSVLLKFIKIAIPLQGYSDLLKFWIVFFIVTFCHSIFPEKSLGEPEILNISGILHYSFFFFLGICFAYLTGGPHLSKLIILLFSIMVFCILGLVDEKQIGLIISFGFVIFWISRVAPIFAKAYPYCFGIYLVSFFFHIPTQFAVKALSSDPTLMFFANIVFGFFGPIGAMILAKRIIPNGVLGLAGVLVPKQRS